MATLVNQTIQIISHSAWEKVGNKYGGATTNGESAPTSYRMVCGIARYHQKEVSRIPTITGTLFVYNFLQVFRYKGCFTS